MATEMDQRHMLKHLWINHVGYSGCKHSRWVADRHIFNHVKCSNTAWIQSSKPVFPLKSLYCQQHPCTRIWSKFILWKLVHVVNESMLNYVGTKNIYSRCWVADRIMIFNYNKSSNYNSTQVQIDINLEGNAVCHRCLSSHNQSKTLPLQHEYQGHNYYLQLHLHSLMILLRSQ